MIMQIDRPASSWSTNEAAPWCTIRVAAYDTAGAVVEVPVSAMRAGESSTKDGLLSHYLGVYGAAVLE